MKFLQLLAIIIAFPVICLAQSNYKTGSVTKTNGDVVNGYINYQEWSLTPKTVEFKTNLSTKEVTKFSPAELKSFEVTGIEKFLTYTGRISMDKNTFPDVADKLDTITIEDVIFLKVVYEGHPVSLLQQQDKLKTRYFVMEPGSKPSELKYYQYYDKNGTLRGLDTYREILSALALKYNRANTQLEAEVNNTHFLGSDISKLIKHINNDQAKAASTSGVRFFAGVLASNTSTAFKGASLFDGMSQSSFFPRVSIGADIFNNINTQKLIFRGELSFFAIKPRFETVELTGATPTSTAEYKGQFDQKNITFTPQVIYNFYNEKNFKVFIGIGIGINYAIYSNNQLYRIKTTLPNFYKLQKLWLNAPVQAGVAINRRFDIFGTYMLPSDYNDSGAYKITNTIYGVGVHYYFNKI